MALCLAEKPHESSMMDESTSTIPSAFAYLELGMMGAIWAGLNESYEAPMVVGGQHEPSRSCWAFWGHMLFACRYAA